MTNNCSAGQDRRGTALLPAVRRKMARLPMGLWIVAVTLLFLAVAAPAGADTETLNFSGTVVLPGPGGTASSTFSGSVTWDPSSSPFFQENSPGLNVAEYTPVAESFTLNSTETVGMIIDPEISIFIAPTGLTFDQISVSFGFFEEDLGTPEGNTYEQGLSDIYVEIFKADLVAPLGSFGGTSVPAGLPTSLDFLGSVSSADSEWTLGNSPVYSSSNVTSELAGTLNPTAPGSGSGSGSGTMNNVPEPGSLSLSLLGICALGFFASRRFRPQGSL